MPLFDEAITNASVWLNDTRIADACTARIRYPQIIPTPGTAARAVDSAIASSVGNGRELPTNVRIAKYRAPIATADLDEIGVQASPDVAIETVPIQYHDYILPDRVLADMQSQDVITDVHDVAIEHAHAVYATGSGDVLGPYAVHHDFARGLTRIRYAFTGSAETIQNMQTQLQDAFVHLNTAAANATNSIISFGTAVNELTITGDGLTATIEADFATAVTDYTALFTGGPGVFRASTPNPELHAKLEVAKKTAEQLLLANLDEQQQQMYLRDKAFLVVTPTGRTYRLSSKISGNVELIHDGKPVRRYCAHHIDPHGQLPMGDHLLCQAMALKYDEREFLRMANTWDLLQPGAPFVGQGVDASMVVQ